jgi:hypothetical protein
MLHRDTSSGTPDASSLLILAAGFFRRAAMLTGLVARRLEREIGRADLRPAPLAESGAGGLQTPGGADEPRSKRTMPPAKLGSPHSPTCRSDSTVGATTTGAYAAAKHPPRPRRRLLATVRR